MWSIYRFDNAPYQLFKQVNHILRKESERWKDIIIFCMIYIQYQVLVADEDYDDSEENALEVDETENNNDFDDDIIRGNIIYLLVVV